MEKSEKNYEVTPFLKMWRAITGRPLAKPSNYYQHISQRHNLSAAKLNKLRKRRAKNKVARKTRQHQRAAMR